jgi:hypothetical protein
LPSGLDVDALDIDTLLALRSIALQRLDLDLADGTDLARPTAAPVLTIETVEASG